MKSILGIQKLALTEFAISANAIVGIRDSGKTWTATLAAEELFDGGIPFIALDPIGVWHWLRTPGKGKGYPVVVAGGRAGDLPLTVKNCSAIVREAMKSGICLVLDLFSVELSKADWKRIVRETVEILLHENADHGLRHIFIEEAAEFVPQRLGAGGDAHVFAAVEKLVRMGGNSKLGCTLINQRSADLNKSVLELCATVLVHRQTGKNTLMDLHKWFDVMGVDSKVRAQIAETLPKLVSGTCWVLSTELDEPQLVKVKQKNSKHPDRREAPTASAPVVLKSSGAPREFIDRMRDAFAPKPKVVASHDPRGKTVTLAAPAVSTAQLEKQLARARDEGRAEGFAIGWPLGWREGHFRGCRAQLKELSAHLGGLAAAATPNAPNAPRMPGPEKLAAQIGGLHIPPARGIQSDTLADLVIPNEAGKAVMAKLGNGALEGPLRRILDAIAWWNALGIAQPTQTQVGFIAKYSAKSGTWSTYLGKCRSQGLIEGSGNLSLTDGGSRYANIPEVEPTGEELRERVLAQLEGPHQKILRPLLEAFPGGLTQEEAGQAAGYSHQSGTWSTYLGKLRGLDLVTTGKTLAAKEWLFPEAA